MNISEGNLKSSTSLRLALIVLVCIVIARGLSLEKTDLIDPTEARYATVAQEMVESNDWITPKLPSPEGAIPYLGKPPLHFWMTALSYKLFNFEEWSARLPSFLAALISLLAVMYFAHGNFGSRVGLLSGLVLFSSVLFFFIAGASVTDMTLTAGITASIVFLFELTTSQRIQFWKIAFGALFAGLAFLCKGPVALALIACPFALWSVVYGEYRWLKSVPWLSLFIIFALVVAPWFVLSEIQNPGFIKYFIWNENIARYLFRDYGDRYGTGHVYTYGTSWIMLAISFVPWSLFLIWGLYRTGPKKSWKWIKADRTRFFVFAWGISAALFFTFVRQLHAMYILPALPGLAIFTALVCQASPLSQEAPATYIWIRQIRVIALVLFTVISCGIIAAGSYLAASTFGIISGVLILISGGLLLRNVQQLSRPIQAVTVTAWSFVCCYLIVITSLSPYIDQRRSAESILKDISRMGIKRVAVVSGNSFSPYWTSKAWRSELENKVRVRYFMDSDIPENGFKYLLAKSGTTSIAPQTFELFDLVTKNGTWELYKRKRG